MSEQITYGTCACGAAGQLFRSGKCAHCHIAELEAARPEVKLSENVSLDDATDVATVYGVKISGALLRALGEPTPPGWWLRVIKVKDGVATVEQRTEESMVAAREQAQAG
jgi:hypothetical protein